MQEISNTGLVYLYVQYQYNTGLLAGKLNSYYLNSTPLSYVINSTGITVNPPSLGLPLLLTFRNLATSIATVSVTYGSVSSDSNISLIVGVCIGSVALIIILIFAYRMRKRCLRSEIGGASAIINANDAVMKEDGSLTDKEVNKYFP